MKKRSRPANTKLKELQEKAYEFILEARIKKDNNLRLIISYSDKRASKDWHNRRKRIIFLLFYYHIPNYNC